MRSLLSLSAIVVISLLSLWALFVPGFFRAHDFVHAARIAEMSDALQAGHIPPRWSANFGYGYGMPLFNFYAPLPFIVGALLFQLFPIVAVLKLLIAIASIATAVGSYYLARQYFSTVASLLATAIVTLAPYRAVNIYVRGALSELWGIAWVPWLLLGVSRVIAARGGFLFVAVATAGMALSHNLVTLMAVCAATGWAVVLLCIEVISQRMTYRSALLRISRLFMAYMLGIGVASWYILPSLLEKQFTKLDATILSGYFDYRLHFLYLRQLVSDTWGFGGSQWGPDDGMSFFIGYGQLIAIAASVVIAGRAILQHLHQRTISLSRTQAVAVSTVLIVVVVVALTLTHAQPLWELFPPLSYLQFPWRWLSIVTVATGLLVAFVYSSLDRYWLKLLFILVILVSTLFASRNFRPESWLSNPDDLYYTEAKRIRSHMSEILPDYIPSGIVVERLGVAESLVPEQAGTRVIQHIVNRPHEHLLQIRQEKQQSISVNIAYFPGWRVEINGEPTLLSPDAFGRVSFTLPAGESMVGLYFGESPIRQFADGVAAFAGLVLVYRVLLLYKKQ